MLPLEKNRPIATQEYSAEVLKAIAQPTHLKIIELLRDGEHCVCEIFPAIVHEQSNISRHLQTMLKSGVYLDIGEWCDSFRHAASPRFGGMGYMP
jgi:DNA-binding transcriptional ArsR family regulator